MKATNQPSIYRNQSAKLNTLYQQAGDPRKVLCVAFDFAKSKHLALCCDGNGEILRKPFPVENNRAGIDFLVEALETTASRRKIPKSQIFLGGEDEPPYVSNFLTALRKKGYLVMRVSAFEAKRNRSGLHATTDRIDLLGIAHTLISRRARDTEPADLSVYQHLRELTRHRRSLVCQQTASRNRIHAIADQLFPGFLQAPRSGIGAFTEASLALMEDRFSAPQIARRRHSSLSSTLCRHGIRDHNEAAAKLIDLARQALPPDPARVPTLQRTLAAAIDLHRCLHRNALELRREAAQSLVATPYALLTSIPGIGFVLAAGLAGELGPPEPRRTLDQTCAYAGIVPRTYQTGGPDKPAAQGKVSRRCNRILKDWTVQSAMKLHLYGPPEIRDRIVRWNHNGQHGLYAAARRYLRLALTLTRNGMPYLPPEARAFDPNPSELEAGARSAWETISRKWRTIPGGLELITDEQKPIGFWRRTLLELHGIQLPRGS